MARTLAKHGTRLRYNQGCIDGPGGEACTECRGANNEYARNRDLAKKARAAGAAAPSSVTQLPVVTLPLSGRGGGAAQLIVAETGPVELGVIASLEKAPAAVEARPDLAASARAMARIQDSALTVAQATNAARQMREIMADLMKGAQRKRKLAAVRQMTNPSAAAG